MNFETGVVTEVSDSRYTVRVRSETRTVDRSAFPVDLPEGTSILMQGGAIVGQIRQQPAGKKFQV